MVSRLIYKFTCAPSPPPSWFKKVQAYINNYIWSNGVHHMTAALIYQPINLGGLGMINLILFDRAIKIYWLFKAVSNSKAGYSLYLQSCLSIPLAEFLSCNIRSIHLKKVLTKKLIPFWDNALQYYCDLHFTQTKGHLGLMPVGYNSALYSRTAIHTVFKPDIVQLYNELGIRTVSDFVDKFDSLTYKDKRRLGANHVFKAVSNEWVTMIDSNQLGELSPIESVFMHNYSVHSCYSILLQSQLPLVYLARTKWEQIFDTILIDEWNSICSKSTQIVEIKLRSFYLRFVNRAFHMNSVRAKYTPNFSPNCSLCDSADETFMHLFWDCPKSHSLWLALIDWCQEHISATVIYSKINCLLLGFDIPVLNIIMTICKYHIYLLKLFGGSFEFSYLLHRIDSVRAKDWLAYRELPYLNISVILKRWAPIKGPITDSLL